MIKIPTLKFREQVAIFVFAVFVLLYAIAAVNNQNQILQQQHQRQHALLHWLVNMDKRITAENDKKPTVASKQQIAVAQVIQHGLIRLPITEDSVELTVTEDNTVRLTIKEVSFVALHTWLTELWRQHRIMVNQASIHRGSTSGMVRAELTLSA